MYCANYILVLIECPSSCKHLEEKWAYVRPPGHTNTIWERWPEHTNIRERWDCVHLDTRGRTVSAYTYVQKDRKADLCPAALVNNRE